MAFPRLPFQRYGDLNYESTLRVVGLTPRSIEAVMRSWPDPLSLMAVSETELQAVGVSEAQARRLLGALDLVRMMKAKHRFRHMTHPDSVVALLMPTLGVADQEIVVALSVDSRYRLIHGSVVAVGDIDTVVVTPRCVFRDAIRVMAAGVVLAHNHPSGNPEPSDADVIMTNRLVRAGELLGVYVWDHVVIGHGGKFCSLQRLGLVHRRPHYQ